LKSWIQKFVVQLGVDPKTKASSPIEADHMSDERGTLLFIIDAYSKHLIETDHSSARRIRETMDEFARALIEHDNEKVEKTLFQFRQFFSSHRIEETTYVHKTFDEFRKIIWEVVEHLGEEAKAEESEDSHLNENLVKLREAVEVNSIEEIKSQSRLFIDEYIKAHKNKETRKIKRMDKFKKNLSSVKKQLIDANNSLKQDHLTKAFNRRSFDDQLKNYWNMFQLNKQPVTLLAFDIDYFKRINDTFGHPMGDFILIECVKILKESFSRDNDIVARIGGEEFAIILPDYQIEHAMKKAESLLERIRKETFIDQDMRVQFTASIGIAQLLAGESSEQWLKRADLALYDSKKSGRDRFTVAPHITLSRQAS